MECSSNIVDLVYPLVVIGFCCIYIYYFVKD
nr:MAG TPA: protein of unknown function (DUF4519) [Bacteriophage sp.]